MSRSLEVGRLTSMEGVTRFVYCSSTEAIGAVEDVPAREDHTRIRSTRYGRSKLKAEGAVRQYDDKLKTTIIRPTGIYGPRNIDDISYYFVTSCAKNSLATRMLVRPRARPRAFNSCPRKSLRPQANICIVRREVKTVYAAWLTLLKASRLARMVRTQDSSSIGEDDCIMYVKAVWTVAFCLFAQGSSYPSPHVSLLVVS